MWDLSRPLESDCKLELFKFDSDQGKKVFWHSSAHILGQALERRYPNSKLCTGPPLDDGGFYYDIGLPEGHAVGAEDFEELEALANGAVAEKQPFERLMLTKAEALEMFAYNKYKVELINTKVPDGALCSAYRCGPLIDLCKGPHLPNTNRVKAFAVTKNSSSYWRGDAKNDSLQRVYGIAFPDKKQLKEYQHFIEEAKKRDHRLVGVQQQLLMFHELSPGSAFFLPHGTRIYNRLIEFIRNEYRFRGFSEVITPNIYNKDLWETSGHWQVYQENMFVFDVEEQKFALKPMNCPGHCLIFDSRMRSYRELPLRLADFGVLHRNELSGALAGLTRVRRFQQDDAHIFCAQDQIQAEIKNALAFMKHVYGIFGFTFQVALSTRPEQYLGEVETWDRAEAALKAELDATFPGQWKLNPGDGAFYGPKIDVRVTDALNRQFQCATLQLDFQLPIRFKLKFRNQKDEEERPVIIHRAIFGSVERFMAILIEHTGGKWPFWISPRQAIVVTVSDKFNDYAKEVQRKIHAAGFDVDLDETDNTLPKKIREAQIAQFNFIIVVGQQEVEKQVVNVRTRDNVVHGERSVDALIEEFKKLREEHQ